MSAPVVLLHGLATSSQRTWVETGWVDLLADAGREVITIDLPGHGGRAPLDSPEAYAELDEIISADLPDGPLDAVGFSAGARVLLRLEIATPGRFDRLVLSGIGERAIQATGHDGFAASIESTGADDGSGASADPDAEVDLIAHHFIELARSSGSDIDAVMAIMRRPGTPVSREDLGRVKADTLVVIGDRDPAGPGEPLADGIPGARLVILPGVDHFATPKSMGFLDAGLQHLDAF
jgi:pimeloyl-ACP methyl ester carboxylesterase